MKIEHIRSYQPDVRKPYHNVWRVTRQDGEEFRVETWRLKFELGAELYSKCGCGERECEHQRIVKLHEQRWYVAIDV